MVRRRVVAALVALGLAGLAACSSDPDTPLGNEFTGDVLGSRPGHVFQDTIAVSPDTVLAFNSLITQDTTLQLGKGEGYRRAIVLRPDFTTPAGNESRIVQSAVLRLRKSSGDDVRARFYTLAHPYTEGDSIAVLDTARVIMDPDAGTGFRTVKVFPETYPLPIDLVQGWIRGDSLSNGIAVVYEGAPATGEDLDLVAELDSSEKTSSGAGAPQIEVRFADDPATAVIYAIPDDATFMRATTTTPNLVVSDGYVRRVYFRFDLSDLPDSAAVHRARIQFHVVPGSVSGGQVDLYIPDTADVTMPGIRTGQLVTNADIASGDETVEFTVTNALLAVLSGDLKDTGWGIKFVSENTALRYVQFYSSSEADPNLRPRIVLTASTPATFAP